MTTLLTQPVPLTLPSAADVYRLTVDQYEQMDQDRRRDLPQRRRLEPLADHPQILPLQQAVRGHTGTQEPP